MSPIDSQNDAENCVMYLAIWPRRWNPPSESQIDNFRYLYKIWLHQWSNPAMRPFHVVPSKKKTATPGMIPDVTVFRYPLEDVLTMVFKESLI